MEIEIARAKESEQHILANLWELYCYDFSEILSSDVGRDGRFGDRRGFERHWTDPRRYPFIIRVDGRLAGFVLVRRHSDLTGDDDVADMAEFFVMRKYRRLGVGERVQNVAAQVFWRKVVDRYTAGRFEERLWDDEQWQGSVFFFQNSREEASP